MSVLFKIVAHLWQLDPDGKNGDGDDDSGDFQCDLIRNLLTWTTPFPRIK